MKKFILTVIFLSLGLSFTNSNALGRIRSIRNRRVIEDREIRDNGFYREYITDNTYVEYLGYWFIKFHSNKLEEAVKEACENFPENTDISQETRIERLSLLIEMGLILKDVGENQISLDLGQDLFSRKYDFYLDHEAFNSNKHWIFVPEVYKNQFDMLNDRNKNILGKTGKILSEVFKYYLKNELKDSPDQFEAIIFKIEDYNKDNIDLTEDIVEGRVIPYQKALNKILLPKPDYINDNDPRVVKDFIPDLSSNCITVILNYYIETYNRDKDKEILCAVCFDENVTSDTDIITCSNGHAICKECLAKSIYEGIAEQNPDNFTCNGILGTECNCQYTIDQLRSAGIKENILKRVLAIRANDTIREIKNSTNIKDLFTCPKCGLTGIIPGIKEEQAHRCQNCKYRCCPNCLEEPHFGISCEEAKLNKVNDIHLFFNKSIDESLLVKCSGCGIPIQKDEECNKLHCTSCGAFTCHSCGKNIGNENDTTSKPYDHFRNSDCPIFYKDPDTGLAFSNEKQEGFLFNRAIEKAKQLVYKWIDDRLTKSLPIKLYDRELNMNSIDIDRLLDSFAEEARRR